MAIAHITEFMETPVDVMFYEKEHMHSYTMVEWKVSTEYAS